MKNASFRAQLVARRTYSRPKNDIFNSFETWEETISRVILHQSWLWERAKGSKLSVDEHNELNELRQLLLDRKVMVAGRTLWLGGTEISKKLELSQFNCTGIVINTIRDVVDAYWCLMVGAGVGFEPLPGTLSGFTKPVNVEVIRSNNKTTKGREYNIETIENGIWTIGVGDSAQAWVKAVGKILANKIPVNKLIIDFSEIRAAGTRLSGFGWIGSGDATISIAFPKIAEILNKRVASLLTRIDILDIMNWLGTTLSSRRSAELCMVPYHDVEAKDFINAKSKNFWNNNPQRAQSNNSVVFWHKPTKNELRGLFQTLIDNGGGEPGFINGQAAKKRANYFATLNPCVEALLGNKSLCNLCEINLNAFNNDWSGLLRASKIIARANYRQTCVNLEDGILQSGWHELNQFLRLMGVGLTGFVLWEHCKNAEALKQLKAHIKNAANEMAKELNLPPSQNVTLVKPSGTIGKILDTTEGMHKPLGQYIFNRIEFSNFDPLVEKLREANYEIEEHPLNKTSVLINIPFSYPDCEFKNLNGTPVNLDSAIDQLDRYKLLMDNYVDHSVSATISYDPEESSDIINWLHKNWDHCVGVSFLFRAKPWLSAEELGFAYVPQQVVDAETYTRYINLLKSVDIDYSVKGSDILDDDGACANGACPIR